MSGLLFDFNELLKRAIKYLVLGLVIALVAFSIPKHKLKVEEVVVVGLSAAASFAILDIFAPSIGQAARTGAGYGIGLGIAGGVPMGGVPLHM
jgi:cell division protein FtsW (lipid II flippase)